MDRFDYYVDMLSELEPIQVYGRIVQVVGLVIESIGPASSIGDLCTIRSRRTKSVFKAEVVGFRENRVLLMPLDACEGIAPGDEVIANVGGFNVNVGDGLLGRVINGFGEPIDGKGPLEGTRKRSVFNQPPDPMLKKRVDQPMITGIRSIDGLITCGKGQRAGIFAGSGVGKSTLLGMIARNTEADVNVIGLIGERGKEVRDFLERDLGEAGLQRSVVVVVTSDKPALLRVKGAFVATTIAEYFRNQGRDVMLMMDSITRVAMAQREIGLAVGEPPTTRGYTPSVFSMLPRLLERSGTADCGSITGLYTVLVEADDMNEPVADSVRSILDGHIVLSRRLAAMNHYPAIDILESVSRVMTDVISPDQKKLVKRFLQLLAIYREAEDLIRIGAYVKGTDEKIDAAISKISALNNFMQQDVFERVAFKQVLEQLQQVVGS
ncbi:flagellar protein export ATPase FliI [candidate division KSB1 bacterium]|nr:flagellar protein export ATPase FliI [candidate division KSB1 bacterium]